MCLSVGQCHTRVTDEEKEDSELQRAIEEMRRLDEILSVQICKEKEVKRQRKELQTKLWQELLVCTVFEKTKTLFSLTFCGVIVEFLHFFFCSRISLKVTLDVPTKL